MTTNWNFDREGRITGWQVAEGLVCASCATDGDGDPVTMEEAGEGATCARCGERVA